MHAGSKLPINLEWMNTYRKYPELIYCCQDDETALSLLGNNTKWGRVVFMSSFPLLSILLCGARVNMGRVVFD